MILNNKNNNNQRVFLELLVAAKNFIRVETIFHVTKEVIDFVTHYFDKYLPYKSMRLC